MRNYFVILLCAVLYSTAFGQTKSYPFEVQKTGQGARSILFIPGFACSGEVWKETTAQFENDYNCYTFTMAGFAGVPTLGSPRFGQWKTAIARYIEDNAIEKPILVGHSMGGALAMAIAADYPDLLDRIVVVDALPCLQALSNPDFNSQKPGDCSIQIKQLTQVSDKQFKEMQKQSISMLVADTTVIDKVVGWSIASDREVFGQMYCDFWNTDLREKIKSIKCPTLVLLEANFVHFKPAIEAQYKNLKTANLQYANKGLHFIMYDDWQWYMNQLTNFIKEQ